MNDSAVQLPLAGLVQRDHVEAVDTPPLETFVELVGEPGQAGLGPTADNDLDLLQRHLMDDGPPMVGGA